MRMKRLALLAVIAVFVLVGCGGGGGDSSGPAPIPPIVNVTGTWDAWITATGGTQVSAGTMWTSVVTVVQSQSDSSVSGTWVTSGGGGQVSGSISGDDLDMNIAETSSYAGIYGSYHGVAMVNAAGNQMNGTYSGSDYFGTLQASFMATKRK